MQFFYLCVCLLISGGLIPGCGSEGQQDKKIMEQLDKSAGELAGESNENMTALVQSPGTMSNNAERLAKLEASTATAAADSSEEQSQILLDQSAILRELQELVAAFERSRNSFASAGGLNLSQVNDREEILDRVQLIDEMRIALKRLDDRAPVLFTGLGDASETGLKKIEIMQGLRSNDFEKMPLMKQYLLILYDNWNSIEVTAENKVFFGDTSGTVVEEFNQCGRSIHTIDLKQAELTKAFIALDQP